MRETAAIAVAPEGGGPSRLVLFVVLQGPPTSADVIKAAAQGQIRARLNPLFKVHDVVVMGDLPRTASNKVMRRTLRDMASSSP